MGNIIGNIIVAVILVAIVVAAVAKIIVEKKKGAKCIGCPYGKGSEGGYGCCCSLHNDTEVN